MSLLDQISLLGLIGSDPRGGDKGREALEGLFVGEKGVLATDGHMLVSVQHRNGDHAPIHPGETAREILEKAKAREHAASVSLDPALVMRACKAVLEANGMGRAKKGLPQQSPFKIRLSIGKSEAEPVLVTADVGESIGEKRAVEILIMPLREPVKV